MFADMTETGQRFPSLAATITALGIAQIISWGTLFYTIAVLGNAMRAATGVGEITLFACYSTGLVISGLVAPWLGRQIDVRGGRPILAGGSALAALACASLASVQGPVTLLVAWLLAGIAMAATLYDPAFATLHHVAGSAYRRSVTALTLFGGFASTVFWPLSQALLESVGMRATFAIYALLHLAVCLPLHLLFVPRHRSEPPGTHVTEAQWTAAAADGVYFWLAVALTLASLVASALSAHLIELVTASGLSAREAVLIGALIGPMQVVGRVMELMLGRRMGPIAAGTAAFSVLAVALAMFAMIGGSFALAVGFAVLYGWSNGVMTIVRGTVPAELFGRRGYGALLGRLAMPQFIARALAPAALAALLVIDRDRVTALAALVAAGLLALIAYRHAVRRSRAAP